MISFKTSPATHDALSKWSRRGFAALFALAVGFLALTAFAGYGRANAILKDHGVAIAPVEFRETTEERHRRGRKSVTYHFTYTFEAKGKQYTGEFATSESNADPYLEDEATVEVAYANADPSRFDRLELLRNQVNLSGIFTRLLFAIPIAALLAFLLHLMLVRRLFVRYEAEATPASS